MYQEGQNPNRLHLHHLNYRCYFGQLVPDGVMEMPGMVEAMDLEQHVQDYWEAAHRVVVDAEMLEDADDHQVQD